MKGGEGRMDGTTGEQVPGFSFPFSMHRFGWRDAGGKEGKELVTRFEKDLRCRPGWIVPTVFPLPH